MWKIKTGISKPHVQSNRKIFHEWVIIWKLIRTFGEIHGLLISEQDQCRWVKEKEGRNASQIGFRFHSDWAIRKLAAGKIKVHVFFQVIHHNIMLRVLVIFTKDRYNQTRMRIRNTFISSNKTPLLRNKSTVDYAETRNAIQTTS